MDSQPFIIIIVVSIIDCCCCYCCYYHCYYCCFSAVIFMQRYALNLDLMMDDYRYITSCCCCHNFSGLIHNTQHRLSQAAWPFIVAIVFTVSWPFQLPVALHLNWNPNEWMPLHAMHCHCCYYCWLLFHPSE